MENKRNLFLCDEFRKTDLGIDSIANAFRGLIQNTRLFSIFSSFSILSFIFSKNGKKRGGGGIFAYPQRIVQIIHYLYSKDGFTYGDSI